MSLPLLYTCLVFDMYTNMFNILVIHVRAHSNVWLGLTYYVKHYHCSSKRVESVCQTVWSCFMGVKFSS